LQKGPQWKTADPFLVLPSVKSITCFSNEGKTGKDRNFIIYTSNSINNYIYEKVSLKASH